MGAVLFDKAFAFTDVIGEEPPKDAAHLRFGRGHQEKPVMAFTSEDIEIACGKVSAFTSIFGAETRNSWKLFAL